MLLTPKPALASQADNDVIEIEGSAEARARWDVAVRRAHEEGLPVYYGKENAEPSSSSLLRASARTVSVAKQNFVDTSITTVTISANYAVSSSNRIEPFNWAKIYNNILDLKSSTYNLAMLDGGRTAAVNFHAVFTLPAVGIGNFVGDFYAEFYNSFTGRFY